MNWKQVVQGSQIIEVVNNVKLTCAILHARFTEYDEMQKGFK